MSMDPRERDEQAGERAAQEAAQALAALDQQLSGRLPCVVCGYNLQGLSVLGTCPECGSAVRATILAAVDPYAEELRPIRRPWLVAGGLLIWSGAGLGAAVLCWVIGVLRVGYGWAGMPMDAELAVRMERWLAGLIVAAGLGSLGLLRPHAGLGVKSTLMALAGTAAYFPLAFAGLQLLEIERQWGPVDGLELWTPDPLRTQWRLIAGLLVVIALVGLRPHARALVARSLVIRTGRVDRQTMLAMALVVLIAMGGDVVGLVGVGVGGMAGDAMKTAGMVFMIAGWLLLTLGLGGAMVDCLRIARAVITPAAGPREVFAGPGADQPTSGGGQ
jgi:hypothetical protein